MSPKVQLVEESSDDDKQCLQVAAWAIIESFMPARGGYLLCHTKAKRMKRGEKPPEPKGPPRDPVMLLDLIQHLRAMIFIVLTLN